MHNYFGLHWPELFETYVAITFVPQLDIRLPFESLCLHHGGYIDLMGDKHSAFSPTTRNKFSLVFDETAVEVESNCHSLLHYLSYRNQILRYRRDMHHFLDVAMKNWMKPQMCRKIKTKRGIINPLHDDKRT